MLRTSHTVALAQYDTPDRLPDLRPLATTAYQNFYSRMMSNWTNIGDVSNPVKTVVCDVVVACLRRETMD